MRSSKPRPQLPDPLAMLKASVVALDARHVDELYGLEPVFEPESAGGAALLRDYAEFLCPWCCEVIGTTVDLTAGSRQLIEDCQVCCHPMELSIDVGAQGELRGVSVQRVD